MGKGTDRMMRSLKQYFDIRWKIFSERHGQNLIDLFDLPVKIVLSPFTLAFDIAGSAPRGFGVPKLVSDVAFSTIFAVATIGTYDIAIDLGKKLLCQRNCGTCSGWQALRCSMCKGTGTVHYQVKNYSLRRGEKATAAHIAEAITDNRAEIVHLPSSLDLNVPLPSKDCPTCMGSGVMSCPECKGKLQVRISADDIMEPPWKAYNVTRKMEYPYENIVESMKDPRIAEFWLITLPQIVGDFTYDEEVKEKIWWAYKESMRYDILRDVVAKRKPGWEQLQKVLVSIDPFRAKDDPVIVKNIPYYKAKKALEAEVMQLDAPPRPDNWGDLNLPLNGSSWTREELKDPKIFGEMTILLNAQREMAERILDSQWEAKWRQDKLKEMLEEKVKPFIPTQDNSILPSPIILPSENQDQQRDTRRRRWWFF